MAGQTLAEIRALLADAGFAPLHRFGQNFLIDLNLMRKMVAAADLSPRDLVLEVGCGTGSLTELLLEAGATVLGVEIDRGLQRILAQRFAAEPRFSLLAGDILESKHRIRADVANALRQPSPLSRKLVSNLPYQVATPLLMELLRTTPPLRSLTCTIQREVGQRLLAAPGSRAYGPLAIVVQSLAHVDLVVNVPAAAFWPRPKIESVTLNILPAEERYAVIGDLDAFMDLLHRGFSTRRKMLRNALLGRADDDQVLAALAEAGISSLDRPEQIAPAQWRNLHAAISRRRRECAWPRTDE